MGADGDVWARGGGGARHHINHLELLIKVEGRDGLVGGKEALRRRGHEVASGGARHQRPVGLCSGIAPRARTALLMMISTGLLSLEAISSAESADIT